jgi:homoserine dehydrogenase
VDAGNANVVVVGSGVVGAVVASIVADRTKKFSLIAKLLYVISAILSVAVVFRPSFHLSSHTCSSSLR